LSGLQRTHIGLVVDQNFADLYLREDDHSTANRKFTDCFKLSRKLQWMENTLYSLEHLADLSSGMNNFHVTLGWAGIFLVLALKSELKLATMRAFVCLGQLFVVQGDHETALNVFNIALDGFTFMNVHRWRADCMVRIAEIWEQKAEVAKSVELWKQARPLFEKSSQAQDVTRIDLKLASVHVDIYKTQHGEVEG
jgi:hypothetical protein